jgi:PAS domain S-box-containing protein
MTGRGVADEARDQQLREGEQRLWLALEAGQMGTWEWNVTTNQVIWSPGLEAIHGLAPGAFAGTFAEYQKDIHPDDRERILGAIARTMEQGEDHHIEYRIVWPDGSLHWVEGRGKLVRDSAGAATRMIGVCMDVTERKRAEERQKLLLDELNHRVRNMLAIIQSIAGQTLRETPDPAAFRDAFSARLAAFARAHSLLTKELWQGVALHDIVATALAPFGGDDRRDAVRIEGPPVVIRPNAVVTLSLVLHELATNAAKHGALTAPQGKVGVAWSKAERPGQPPLVELVWNERGGPSVQPPRRQGFGSRLIAASVEQLGGEMAVRYADGLEARFRFPLSESEATGRPVSP